jgi:hypothetical protein
LQFSRTKLTDAERYGEGHAVAQAGGSPVIAGMQIFHDYIRPHVGLDGKTSAEAAGMTVEGENRWLTLIQNTNGFWILSV